MSLWETLQIQEIGVNKFALLTKMLVGQYFIIQ